MRNRSALGGGPYHFFRKKLAKGGRIEHLLGRKLLLRIRSPAGGVPD
jgi:hypothetical protein